MTTISAPTLPQRPQVGLSTQGGTYLKSANGERLQAIADALHVLTHNARCFEQAAPGSIERAEAGLALDCALVAVKALRAGGAQ